MSCRPGRDLEFGLKELTSARVALTGISAPARLDTPGGHTLAAITDPERNALTLVQQ